MTEVIGADRREVTAYYGSDISLLELPINGSMCFDGWYKDSGLEQKASGLITGDCTLYSKWVDGVKLRCYAGGAEYKSVVIKKGSSIGDTIAQPEVSGFCAAGWFYDEGLTQKVLTDDVFSSDTDLYAGYYPNVFDSTADDINGYIAYATHKLSTTETVAGAELLTGNGNRTAVCSIEPGKTYKVKLDFNLRFRIGTVSSLNTAKAVGNLIIDELDTNGSEPTLKKRELTITAGESDTTLLIFYYTSNGAPVRNTKIRETIGVYDTTVARMGFTAPEPPTEPTTETTTEPTTEPPTEPTTEPTTEPVTEPPVLQSCSHFCHSSNGFIKLIYRITCFFWKLFGTNQYCECGESHW